MNYQVIRDFLQELQAYRYLSFTKDNNLTSTIQKCDACGRDFFNPFFLEDEQEKLVASR